jgi:predicted extracellular nuclease
VTLRLAARVVVFLVASGACGAAGETIMQIQGTTHRSPLAGRAVSGVHGIVTARTGSGFYVQDTTGDGDPATSDALFVFTRAAPSVAVGDHVELGGTVFEYRPDCSSATALDDETCSVRSAAFHNLSVTEIVSPSIRVHASGLSPPSAAWIGGTGALPPTLISDGNVGSVEDPAYPFDRARHALDFFETLEGMRVAVAAPLVVGARDSFGVLPVLAELGAGPWTLTPRGGVALTAASANGGRILLDDALAATPQADVGDTLADVEGVLDYRYGSYRLHLTQPVLVTDGSPPKQTAGRVTPGWLSIASFNVENLSATSSREKIEGVAAQIATHLGGPALVALAEMQDDSGAIDDGVTTADGSFGALVAAIEAAGGPAYRFVQIDPEDGADGGAPGANIRVGFLYDPLRVSFGNGSPRIGDATTAIGLDARGILGLDAGRIDPANAVWSGSRKPLVARFHFGGRRLVAIALHLRSKSGDGPLFGRFQPPIATSSAARAAQADVVGHFVEEILAGDPDAAVVVVGDLNDFDFSPALVRLESAGLRNLTKQLPEPERYTFVFDGNAQALDHVLLSEVLAASARYEIVHVNSEYRVAERASDHDPVVAQLAMPAPEPGAGAVGLAASGALASLGAARRPGVRRSGA